MHDEVKRAYTEQALRWHPDRQASGDVDSSATAEWHMRDQHQNPGEKGREDDREIDRAGHLAAP